MNTAEARDLVKAFMTQFGASQVDRVPGSLVDNILNTEMLKHFEHLKTDEVYWHTLFVDGQDEYNLPDGIISVTMIKVANERYFPAPFPYIEDAKRESSGRTRVTEDGTTVSSVGDRWYWILGDRVQIYPEPEENTGTETSGACTTSGSIVTISTGDLGETNEMKRRLALVGSSYYVVLANSSTTFTVDGTLDGTEITYTIYEHGLEIWGIKRPTALTIGGTDAMPGSDVDAMAVVLGASYIIAMMLPDKSKINFSGIRQLQMDYRRQSKQSALNLRSAPITISPWTFRSDHAGAK